MGCVYSGSKTLPTSVFKVTNIDDSGNEKYHGQMEINTCNLVLHKRRDPPIIWPLSTIRRYGYEDSMFCFEAGRSSPYGPGIFAFKSKEAKNIFDTVKEKLQTGSGTDLAKDMSSEVRNYSGQSHTIENVYDGVNLNGLRYRGESNNNSQPRDLMLDQANTYLTQTPYININKSEDDYYVINDPFEIKESLPEASVPTYTEIEIATCIPKKKCESLPTSPVELPSYTAIDFNRTMHLSQKMLKNSDDSGIRKTRHDSTMSNP